MITPTCSVRWSGMLVSHSHLRSAVFAYRAAGVAWVTFKEKFLPPRRLSSCCDQASTPDAHFGETDKDAMLTRAVVTRPVLMPAVCAQSRTVSTGLEVTLVLH